MGEVGNAVRRGLSVGCSPTGCPRKGTVSLRQVGRMGWSEQRGKGTGSNRNQLNFTPSRIWPGFRRSHLEMDRDAKCRMF